MNTQLGNNEKISVMTSVASLCASVIAGLACIGPLLGIALGVGGLGWLSSYSFLTLPASITSIVLLSVALIMFNKRKSSCANRRKHLVNLYIMGFVSLAVIGINVFEYIIFPNLY